MAVGRRPFTADTPYSVAIKQSKDPLPRPKGYIKGNFLVILGT